MQKLQYEAGWMAETGWRWRWLGNMGMLKTKWLLVLVFLVVFVF